MKIDLKPFRLRAFRRLWSAETVNIVGNGIGDVAILVLVFDQTSSALATALIFIAKKFLPAIVAPALSARIEGLPARLSLSVAYFVEAVLFVVLALLADNFMLSLVTLIAFFDGTIAMSARAVLRSSAASVLKPRGELRSGNSLINLAFVGGYVLGEAAGGGLVAAVGVRDALLINAATFLVAGLTLLNVAGLPGRVASAAAWRYRLKEGFAYVRHHDLLMPLLITLGVTVMLSDLVLPLEVIFVKETLGQGDAAFGLFLAAWSAGMAIGGIWFALSRSRRLEVLLLISMVLMGVAFIGTALSPNIYVAGSVQVIGGFGNGFQWVALITLVQEVTDDRFQVRVMSVLESVDKFMPGIGFILGGLIGSLFSIRLGFFIAGVGVLLVVITAYFKLRELPWSKYRPTDDRHEQVEFGSALGTHEIDSEQLNGEDLD